MAKASICGAARIGCKIGARIVLSSFAATLACSPTPAQAALGPGAQRPAAWQGSGSDRSRIESRIEQFVAPYADTNNFSGVILVERAGGPLFARAYGLADARARIPNRLPTRFHVASMSMQYTAAAALRLVMARRLSLDTRVARYVPDFPNARLMTIRDLLTQKSGIADINGLDDYDAILRTHQTPTSLVARVRGLPPARPPGTYDKEEHSAYNLLALIIEKETRRPFAQAIRTLVFEPLGMKNSGIDDDRPTARSNSAIGHAPSGVRGIVRAERIHWSAKAGNASAYTTVEDQRRFVEAMTGSRFLSPELRRTVFDLRELVGYGWFKAESKRFGQPAYSMNGRAPGFSSAMIYLPRERLLVVALSNIYASFTPDIAAAAAAIVLGLPVEPLALKPLTEPASFAGLPASFRFGADFYQPNATVKLAPAGSEIFLEWPTGDRSPLIPTSRDHYVDRAYGVAVEVVRDTNAAPTALKYDRFVGQSVRD